MKIEQEALAVLSVCKINGNQLTIPNQLPRKLYEQVNKVLSASGGKWNRKAKAHIFEGDIEGIIDDIILTGEVDSPKDYGYYATPKAIVKQLIDLAEIKPGMVVLEPSAGTGSIAEEIKKITPVICVEIFPEFVQKLREIMGSCVTEANFLHLDPVQYFDRVVMNPPFEKQADIDHIKHADKFLKSDGILVSVMSSAVLFRENKKTVEFRYWVNVRGGRFIKLPEGSFKESGTMVNTCIVVIPAAHKFSKLPGHRILGLTFDAPPCERYSRPPKSEPISETKPTEPRNIIDEPLPTLFHGRDD